MKQRGVTLVEVLLAAVVCGAGLAVILEAISTSIRADVFAENKVKAARLLELQLGRIEGGVLPAQQASGDFTQDGEPDFKWTIEVADSTQPNLSQVTIDVQWSEHGDQKDLDAVRWIWNDPDAPSSGAAGVTAGSLMGTGGAAGSLMGGGSGKSAGSLMGTGSSGGNSGSLMGAGGGGGGGGGAGSGSLIGGGGATP